MLNWEKENNGNNVTNSYAIFLQWTINILAPVYVPIVAKTCFKSESKQETVTKNIMLLYAWVML